MDLSVGVKHLCRVELLFLLSHTFKFPLIHHLFCLATITQKMSEKLLQKWLPHKMFCSYKDNKHYSLATSEECSDDEFDEKSTLNGEHQSVKWIRLKSLSTRIKVFVLCSVLLNVALAIVVVVLFNRSQQAGMSHWGKSE